MKKFLLTGIALSALVAGPAMAADLAVRAPIYKAAPPVPVYFSWTGCYVGGHVGGLWARKEWTERTPGAFFGAAEGSHDADSWLAGVQAGCDYQFAGGWVIGIQGDYAWTDADGSNVNTTFPAFTDNTRIRSLSTVTGRIGYAWDRFLGYVKGGGAWERDDYSATTTAGGVLAASARETRSGWTIGVGGEYAFTNYLSGFVEYNYYDFGDRDISFVTPGGAFFSTDSIKETKSVVRGGLNWRFGSWGKSPVTARY